MQLLNRAAKFTTNRRDLRSIYLTYVRSVLEQSAVVWHSSLTVKNRRDLERVQKCAVRVILSGNYSSYNDGLEKLNLDLLSKRREKISLKFAKDGLKFGTLNDILKKKEKTHDIKIRKS